MTRILILPTVVAPRKVSTMSSTSPTPSEKLLESLEDVRIVRLTSLRRSIEEGDRDG